MPETVVVEDQTANLNRYYIIAALVVLMSVTLVVAIIVRQFAINRITAGADEASSRLTERILDELEPSGISFLRNTENKTTAALLDDAQAQRMKATIENLIGDETGIIVNIFDDSSRIVVSSEEARVGYVLDDDDRDRYTIYGDPGECPALDDTGAKTKLATTNTPISDSGYRWDADGYVQVCRDVTAPVRGVNRKSVAVTSGLLLLMLVPLVVVLVRPVKVARPE